MTNGVVFMAMAAYIFGALFAAAPAAIFSRNDRELYTRMLLWPVFLVVLLAAAAMNGLWAARIFRAASRRTRYVVRMIARDIKRAEQSAEES